VFQNLNNLIPPGSGFTLDNATAINDNGQIVVSGSKRPRPGARAFLLTPSQ
jgi:hypothetical protein